MRKVIGIVIAACAIAVVVAAAMVYFGGDRQETYYTETFLDGFGELSDGERPARANADLFGLLSELWPGSSLAESAPLSTQVQDYLKEEGGPSASIFIQKTVGGALVEMVADGFADDSVAGSRFRAVLVEEDGLWRVERMGVQQRCYRSLMPDRWTTSRCP